MKKHFLSCALLSALLSAGSAHAGVVTYEIKDLLTGGYQQNVGQTFAGTGFVGMYDHNAFVNLFGLEGAYSRTNMQVGIANLAGKQITSAQLSFVLHENHGTGGALTITGYDATGMLGYHFSAPAAVYGTAGGLIANGNGATSSYDVTTIAQAALAGGEDWLGMQFTNSEASRWTYTSSDADRAQVRLVVNYTDAPADVPEPASVALLGLGLAGLSFLRRKKN